MGNKGELKQRIQAAIADYASRSRREQDKAVYYRRKRTEKRRKR